MLARRWGGKAELAIAAIRQQLTKNPLDVPDRGDVRTELLELLKRTSDRASAIAAAFTLFTGGYFQESASTPQDLRNVLAEGGSNVLAIILERAVKRGEIDRKKLIPPIATLLNDLFRYHAVMHFAPPPAALRTVWVDAIFLPLVRIK